METKTCKTCGQNKPLTDFRYDRGNYRSECKKCGVERNKFRRIRIKQNNNLFPQKNNNEEITEKKCITCGETKPTDKFTKDKSKKDGLCIYCRDCDSKRQYNYRMQNDAPFDESPKLINAMLDKVNAKKKKADESKTINIVIKDEKSVKDIHLLSFALDISIQELIRISIGQIFLNYQLAKSTNPKLMDKLTPKRHGYL
jgi:hypothetical protein